ncbi:Carboxylic acid transporter protein -like protein [Penicillium subrubescens]|uniref:Carboxylic acid transporter protein-like protein n=2 Tax=Penicillium subrubescens TaxID=1316194 RepID=A0A1Q5TBB2_9EURO|nr:Carboxylic acid transporter protein -like protein [Penicillium subrubescens]
MFAAGFMGWTWDAFDFFTVSMCITEIAADFGVSYSDVSWGMTVTLMLRSVGAIIFGILSDRYGRKWPMIINLGLFIILELGSGFCQTLPQFLGARSLYGIAMGGLFGPAAATALEDLPYEARGLLSGLFEMGYAMGYLLAAAFYRALVPTTSHGWRSLFWFGAGPPVLIIIFRWCLPETNHFQVMKAEREARANALGDGNDHAKAAGLRIFLRDAGRALRENWVLFVYLVVLMAGYNSCSHGSQDFYPTYLKDQVGMNATDTTIITVVGQVGALFGGCTVGYISTFFGRRLTMLVVCVIGGALIPAYTMVRSMSLVASVFFEQFCVGGVWGPMPIHLLELSPIALRTVMVGLTYQLGNLGSSASATIQSIIGERFPLPPGAHGKKRFDYGMVIAIFMGAVWAFMLFFLFWGPEMSQEERDEEAEDSMRLERLRAEGVSLAEIGQQRFLGKGVDDAVVDRSTEHHDTEKAETARVE